MGLAGLYGVPSILLEGGAVEEVVTFFFDLGVQTAGEINAILLLTGLIAGMVLSWLMLTQLKRLYKLKYISDKTIIVDGILIYYTLGLSMGLAIAGLKWFALGLAVFLLYKAFSVVFTRLLLVGKVRGSAPKKLLLLRVFALQKLSDRFFRKLSRLWRLQGPVQMIAGPDLVYSIVEPHEFMDFLTGRLSRQYLASETDVAERIQHLDEFPTTDGNFRVNDFYCFDNTWRQALEGLVRTTDYVVMDLRSFSRQRKGCIHEIKQLFALAAMEKVLFVVDKTTDKPFLEAVIAEACNEMPLDSPNYRLGETLNVRLYLLEGEDYDIRYFLSAVEA